MMLNIPRFLSFWNVLAWHTSLFTNSSVRRKIFHGWVFTTSIKLAKRHLNLEPSSCLYWGSIFQLAAVGNGYLGSYSFPSIPVFWKIRQDIKGNKVLQTHLYCLYLFTPGRDNITLCLEIVYSTNVQEECVDMTFVEFQSRTEENLYVISLWYLSMYPLTQHKKQ